MEGITCTVITVILAIVIFFLTMVKFTTLESGDIKFVTYNGSLHRVIHNVKGMMLDKDGILVPGEEHWSFLNRRFGLWLVGITLYAKVHTFPIIKERENLSGDSVDDWIDRDEGEFEVSSLRFTFPRPYVLKAVKLGDRSSVNILLVVKFEVVNPYIPVFLFKGKFFQNAGADIRGAVIDILKKFDLDYFIEKANKGEAEGALKSMKDPLGEFNKTLGAQVGLRIVGITIARYEASDEATRKAMEAQMLAREQGDAQITEAKKYSEAVEIRAEADSKAQERLAKARGAQVRETVLSLVLPGTDATTATIAAANVLEMQAAAESKITTLVQRNSNGNVAIVAEPGKGRA
jgi:regulator of protease activity HflC (stomatin/prohibitin superfamily)